MSWRRGESYIQADSELLRSLDPIFDVTNQNQYPKAKPLREGLGEDFSVFRDKVLSPRYRASKSQLDRYLGHFYTAVRRFDRNRRLRTLLFRRWNMDGAFNSNGDFRPEVEQAMGFNSAVKCVPKTPAI